MAHVFYPSGTETYIRSVSGSNLLEYHLSTADSGFVIYLTGSGYATSSLTSSYSVSASYALSANLVPPVTIQINTDTYNDLSILNYNSGQSAGARTYFAIPTISGSIGASDGTGQDQNTPNLIIDSTTGIVLSIDNTPITYIFDSGVCPYSNLEKDLGTVSLRWNNVYAQNVYATASLTNRISTVVISPTGSAGSTGSIVYDTSANLLYIYTGTNWKSASFA